MRKILVCILFTGIQLFSFAQEPALHISWNEKVMVSRSIPTLQVVNTPMLQRGSLIHDGSFAAVRNLGADMVRYAIWYPYPKLAVAELNPPDANKTSWDFSFMDPVTVDFMDANKGHQAIFEICTIPQWMFKTDKPVGYPNDPNQVSWFYGGGTELRDTTLKQLGDYFARVASWYHNGGFTDELGKYHKSGYHFPIPYWEVLNEPEAEHSTTIEDYTKRYDAIVKAVRKVLPGTKFVAMALCRYNNPHAFEYFLNPANHEPGIPIDMISYHFYASAPASENFEVYPYAYFNNTDDFLNCVRYIEDIRKRLSPATKVDLDELGTFISGPLQNNIPATYWNMSGAVYAYLFVELSKMGIDVIGESQLVAFPGQFPDVTMIDWTNGKPNARYWVLKLIKDNFAPGDILVKTDVANMWGAAEDYTAQGYIAKQGKKVLLINKKDKTLNIKIPPEFKGGTIYTVDSASGENEPGHASITDSIQLKPFAVAVATTP
jgi:hypothetical protein